MSKKKLLGTGALLLATLPLSGCLIAAGAAAGAVVVDELNEDDGKFNPGERVIEGLSNKDKKKDEDE